MGRFQKNHAITSVAVLLIMSIFASCVLIVLLTGASSYKRLAERDANIYQWRTGLQYISAKIRQSDDAKAVYIDKFNNDTDIDTLFIAEYVDEQVYITRIYCYDGYLYELYSSESSDMQPIDGMEIMPMKNLILDKYKNIIQIELICPDNTKTGTTLMLRSEGGYR